MNMESAIFTSKFTAIFTLYHYIRKNIIGDEMFETSAFLKKAAKIFLVFLLIKFSGKHSEALLASVISGIGEHIGSGLAIMAM